MFLSELCPSLSWRLTGLFCPLLRHVRGSLGSTAARFSSAPLNMTTDDADEPRDPSDQVLLQPGTAYVEPSRSRRVYVERFLRHELGLSWARAEREASRCRHLAIAGLPLMAENLAFLVDRGVKLQHVQEDVDVLGIAHSDLLRVHGLVGGLPDAEFCHYYPLSRARPDTVTELFCRLATRRSNLVHELAEMLRLPELTVSRAVSRMATQITKSSNQKLLNNAKLLMDLGVLPAELSRSLYLLRLSGCRLRRRVQQCATHGVPLLGRYLGMSDANFQRRVTQGGPLMEETADVEAAVALRLGVSRDNVADQTRNSDVLQTITASRLEAVTVILERAGYSPAQRLSGLLTVYRSRPERLRRRLELCGRVGRPRPSLSLLAMDQRRFEKRIVRWRREAGLEGRGDEVLSGEQGEGGSDAEVAEGDGVGTDLEAGEGRMDKVASDGEEVENYWDSEGEVEGLDEEMVGNEDSESAWIVNGSEEGIRAYEDSGDVEDGSVDAPESQAVEGEIAPDPKAKGDLSSSKSKEKEQSQEDILNT